MSLERGWKDANMEKFILGEKLAPVPPCPLQLFSGIKG
jgi:hypothetical protein